MKFWIAHPAADSAPVGVVRWLKWHTAQWIVRFASRWERDALYPDCDDCGKPRKQGDHSKCFELPF